MKKANEHRCSSLDDFLKEAGIYEEVCTGATKHILVEQRRMAAKKIGR